MSTFLAIFPAAGIILILDQITKYLVRTFLLEKSIALIGDTIKLQVIQNPGTAWNIPLPNSLMMVLVPFILTGMFFLYHRMRSFRPALRNPESYEVARMDYVDLGVGWILGGAVGNWIDRMLFGSVTDFIHMSIFPAFNIADAAITAGFLLLALLRVDKQYDKIS